MGLFAKNSQGGGGRKIVAYCSDAVWAYLQKTPKAAAVVADSLLYNSNCDIIVF